MATASQQPSPTPLSTYLNSQQPSPTPLSTYLNEIEKSALGLRDEMASLRDQVLGSNSAKNREDAPAEPGIRGTAQSVERAIDEARGTVAHLRSHLVG